MQNATIIHAPEGKTHLDKSWIKEIPANCLFDKVTCGCGATTLAIEQDGHTIIAMPYVALVRNKEQQHRDTVLGVCEGVTEADILAYINSHSTHKIAVTYDSVPKVVSILQRNGVDVFKDYFLLIDEWQVLVNQYDFRYDAIRALLDLAPLFERVTYMTATPIEPKYRLQELSGLPEVRIEWPNEYKIPIQTYTVNRPADCIASMCRDYDKHGKDWNWHFFVNSVALIASVIKKAGLPPEQVRVVCSQSRANRRKNQTKLGTEYPIAEPLDPVKRFNFYTSTCFEGCDLYDEKGLTFIVNDGNVEHSLVDVSTLFTQIAGRIRNSQYNKSGIVQIYSTTKTSENVLPEEYEVAREKTYNGSMAWADRMNRNNAPDDMEELESKKPYTRIVDGQVIVDRNMFVSDIHDYKLRNYTYSSCSILQKDLTDNNFEIVDSGRYFYEAIPCEATPKIAFRDAFTKYCDYRSTLKMWSVSEMQEIENIERTKPLVKEAYLKLGAQEVERLNYNTTAIRRELAKRLDAPTTTKIIALIRQSLPYHRPNPDAVIKEILQGIYNELEIERTAKSTDLSEWYETKKTTPKIGNVSVAHTTIICEKIVIRRHRESVQSSPMWE